MDLLVLKRNQNNWLSFFLTEEKELLWGIEKVNFPLTPIFITGYFWEIDNHQC
jgi:hypothetical protein